MSVQFEPCAIPFIGGVLQASAAIVPDAKGIVILQSGSRSALDDANLQSAASAFLTAGFSVLAVDLLTSEEHALDEGGGRFSYNLELLAERIGDTLGYVRNEPRLGGGVAIFSEGIGAPAALLASRQNIAVHAVACWNGRAELIEEQLPLLTVPTLFMADLFDHEMLMSSSQAWSAIGSPDKLMKAIEAHGPKEAEAAMNVAARWLSANWEAWRNVTVPRLTLR